MQSRRYEIQQKRLAVRRLSHGTKRGPLSPTGDRSFPQRKRESPEDPNYDSKRISTRTDRSVYTRESQSRPYRAARFQSRAKIPRQHRAQGTMERQSRFPEFWEHHSSKTTNPFDPSSVRDTNNTINKPSFKRDSSEFNKGKPNEGGSGNIFLQPSTIQGSNTQLSSEDTALFGNASQTNPFQVALNKFQMTGTTENLATNDDGKKDAEPGSSASIESTVLKPKDDFQPNFPAVQFGFLGTNTADLNPPQAQEAEITSKDVQQNIFAEALKKSKECTAIKVVQLPESLLNKNVLRNHFSFFGEVKRIKLHSRSSSAVITFQDHASASKAKEHGKLLQEGKDPFVILWYQKSPKSTTQGNKESEKSHQTSKDNNERFTTIKENVEQFIESVSSQRFMDASSKADLLGEIDKIIRMGLEKKTDLKKATAVRGTCPDLCPEKERYLREFQRRLSSFEILAGTEFADTKQGEYPKVDHGRVIKEYSRSSADQEEPLPHELRPPDVLSRTMDFLVTHFMDPSSWKLADWYDFVWSRTRSIRKDITQQHLCDETSVTLIEKCARFHILCAHHLCEESMDCFDPKINHVNLTKSLQSLKHMYADLFEKGITCPNEPEFRSYQVLLNLNNADILREVMEFPVNVRESKDVQFALQVFSALNSSNYVRFFKLLKLSSYLNSCIMHQYFHQIRGKALQIINRAYGLNQKVQFPISDIVRLLAFDNNDQAAEYCEHYGFSVTTESVCLSRTTNMEATEKIAVSCAAIIHEKRDISFGQVVNGAPLPALPDYLPTISFDDSGVYNGLYHQIALGGILPEEETLEETLEESLEETLEEKSDVECEIPFSADLPQKTQFDSQTHDSADAVQSQANVTTTQTFLPVPVMPTNTQAAPPWEQHFFHITKEDVKDVCKELMSDVLDKEIASIAWDVHSNENSIAVVSNQITEQMIARIIVGEAKEIATHAVLTERRRQWEEMQKLTENIALEETENILTTVIDKELRVALLETTRQEERKLKERIRSREISNRCAEVINETVQAEVKMIAEETLTEALQRKKEALSHIHENICRKRLQKYFIKWQRFFHKQKDLKELLFEFPSMRPLKSSRSSVQGLLSKRYGSGTDVIHKKEDYVFTSIQKRREVHMNAIAKYHQHVKEERKRMEKSLDLHSILQQYLDLNKKGESCLKNDPWFLKLVVSVSDESRLAAIKHMTRLSSESLLEKLRLPSNLTDTGPRVKNVETCHFDIHRVKGREIFLSIKELHGSFSKRTEELAERRVLFGTTGIIFLVDCPSEDKTDWGQETHRLHNTILAKPRQPKIPVVAIAISTKGCLSVDQITANLQLQNLKAEGLVNEFSSILIYENDSAQEIDEKLSNALLWLLRIGDTNQRLSTLSLESFIDRGLGDFFFPRVYEDLRERNKHNNTTQNPNALIQLYNNVINHLATVASDADYIDLSWPGHEFSAFLNISPSWNDPDNLRKVKSIISCFYLPEQLVQRGDETIDEQNELCWKYVDLIVKDPLNRGQEHLLYNSVGHILEKWSRKHMQPKSMWKTVFPWLPIVEEIIGFTLINRKINQDHEYSIVFHNKKFSKFIPEQAWEQYRRKCRIDLFNVTDSNHFFQRDLKLRSGIQHRNQELAAIEGKLNLNRVEEKDEKIKVAASKQVARLHQSLSEERLASARMTEILSKSLILSESDADVIKTKRKRSDEMFGNDEDISPVKRFVLGLKMKHLESLEIDLNSFVEDLETTSNAVLADAEHLEWVV